MGAPRRWQARAAVILLAVTSTHAFAQGVRMPSTAEQDAVADVIKNNGFALRFKLLLDEESLQPAKDAAMKCVAYAAVAYADRTAEMAPTVAKAAWNSCSTEWIEYAKQVERMGPKYSINSPIDRFLEIQEQATVPALEAEVVRRRASKIR